MPETDERLESARFWSAVGIGVVAIVLIWFSMTTPDLDNLPAYECNPGHHHTTKECQ